MKNFLMIPLILILVASVGCEQKQPVTQLEVGRDKLLGAGLVIEAVEHLKRAEQEEDNKVEPRALLLIAYTHALSTGDAKVQGKAQQFQTDRAQRLVQMDEAEMKAILQVLNERHRIQADATQVLIDKGSDAVPLLLNSVVKRHYVNLREGDLIDMLYKIGSPALDQIIAAIRDANTPPSVRVDLVRLVGRIGDTSAVSVLEDIRNSSDGALKMEVNVTLYKLGKTEYEKDIVTGLSNSDVAVRRGSAQAMLELDNSPTPQILNALKDSDGPVRMYAARALEKTPDRQAINPLINILKSDSDADVKQAASSSLHVHASQSYGKGLAARLIKELSSGQVKEPKDRLRIVHLLNKEVLRKQIQASPEELNVEYGLYEYTQKREQNQTVKEELDRLLFNLESN
jgi:HEAT repeat protein